MGMEPLNSAEHSMGTTDLLTMTSHTNGLNLGDEILKHTMLLVDGSFPVLAMPRKGKQWVA